MTPTGYIAEIESHFGPLVVNLETSSKKNVELNGVWSDGQVIIKLIAKLTARGLIWDFISTL